MITWLLIGEVSGRFAVQIVQGPELGVGVGCGAE